MNTNFFKRAQQLSREAQQYGDRVKWAIAMRFLRRAVK